MTPSLRVAIVGNSLPRRCGIATFTTDLQRAIAESRASVESNIVAMNDRDQNYAYPDTVTVQIRDDRLQDYERAAHELNASRVDVVCLQHEFGIFGGEAGGHILALLSRLRMPIVTTLHTVLAKPNPMQRIVFDQITAASSRIIVMANKAGHMLRDLYRVPAEKIVIIPHGIPDVPYVDPDDAKIPFGLSSKKVILTFGLLSPNKGIEYMIDAMPSILERCPNTVYMVLGATHPNLVRDHGEAYRESLVGRAADLNIAAHVIFQNQFVDQRRLLEFIAMCDVYVTPYLNVAQMTSGTLAYSFGLGKPVVSTRYWHAQELLADGRGILVPFADAGALGAEVTTLLSDDVRRAALSERAYICSRAMIWPRAAERFVATFDDARLLPRGRAPAKTQPARKPTEVYPVPNMSLGHFHGMCDDTGLFQHAIHCVPDRSHGYCTDDNARALLVACALNTAGEEPLPDVLPSRFAAFLQHAWNPQRRRFRNFMSFERRWLEEQGSEDSHGRALWALGECARSDASASRRAWATTLFVDACRPVEHFDSPRAWSFTLLGLDAYCAGVRSDGAAHRLRILLADRLVALMAATETEQWQWFEDGLAYDNARLPEALIVTGLATSNQAYVRLGLRALTWLMTQQTTAHGDFRPVGSHSFGAKRTPPLAFDQQPLEAAATIAACVAALRSDGDPAWKTEAYRTFAWFHGANDLSAALVDLVTGGCRDGLHPDRANENQGGESVVSYLLSLAQVRALQRLDKHRAALPPERPLSV